MNKDLTIQVAEAPDYDPASFRGYASILHETFAVLGDNRAASSVDIPHKTREDLQWSALKARLADFCAGEEARKAAEALPILQHRESLERRHREVEEAVRLSTLDVSPPLKGLLPIGPYLEHAARGGSLEAEHLLAVAQVARAAGAVQKYFRTRTHLAPLLAQPADDLQLTPELVQAMEHAFDPSGRLSDSASPDLGDLRRRVQNYHERLKRRLDAYLGSKDFASFLQDDYFTLRNDRYVLPIRAGEKGNVPGIVHGASGSGQTLFIEPTELVDMNNDLQIAQMAVEEEERRILARLSALVAARAQKLAANLALLAYVDLTVAKARLACTLGATRPILSRRGALDLRQARHPMLALKALDAEKPFEVVANDISLGFDGVAEADGAQTGAPPARQNVLIISGPNTGGKTVTLKTIGIFCLMARSGLHLPAMAGSEVPLVDAIFTDIGDEQSIERDLSTFSGHVANINSFLHRVDAGSLVLLDELFAGTDPEQGAALATALLEDLAGRGALVAITTHLESLKMLAFKAGGVSNASVGFDLASLSPTYRLQSGLPGSSYAIRIAHRLGMPADIVARAQSVARDTGAADVETILRQLEQKRDALDRDLDRARQLRRDAEKLHAQVEKKLDSLHKREMGLVHQETRKLMDEINVARDLIRRHTRALQEKNAPGLFSHEALAPIRDEINAVADNIAELREARETEAILERREPRPEGTLEVGAAVWVKTFKRTGEVLDLDQDRARAVVRVGGIKATVTLDELYAVRPEEIPAKAPQAAPLSASNQTDPQDRVMAIPPQGEGNTVDLRGMRVEEALERIEIFLDAAMRAREPGIYIIHGHGTGALRSAVRAFMPSCRYVHSYRPGGQGEGGDGVTVAYLG